MHPWPHSSKRPTGFDPDFRGPSEDEFSGVLEHLEFLHTNSKCYLKTKIILITGEQSSKYSFALFLGLCCHCHFCVPETMSSNETTNKIKQGGEESILTVPGTVICGASHLPVYG